MRWEMAAFLVGALVAASPAPAEEPGCRGSLSGAAKGQFRCAASVSVNDEGRSTLSIRLTEPLPGVKSLAPGAMEIAGTFVEGSYTLDQATAARASVVTEGGLLFSATRTTGKRGEMKLTVRRVTRDARARGGVGSLAGSLRAVLVPENPGVSEQVVLEVEF